MEAAGEGSSHTGSLNENEIEEYEHSSVPSVRKFMTVKDESVGVDMSRISINAGVSIDHFTSRKHYITWPITLFKSLVVNMYPTSRRSLSFLLKFNSNSCLS